ncbi:MAG: hypothetical protein H3Z52_07900 [archaeon]|nr:hypothetical protein [archaeon]
MKKFVLFLTLLIASLSGFLLATIIFNAYLAPTTSPANHHIGWMDRMMGWWTSPAQYNVPLYLWIVPVLSIVFIIIAVLGLAYSIAFPEIKTVKVSAETKTADFPTQNTEIGASSQLFTPVKSDNQQTQKMREGSYDVVIKTLKPDERLVLEVLRKHDGKYLQKWIRKETGLTRLKTHRIIARLAERGIVTVKAYGNTNEVALSSWIKLDDKNL